MRGGYFRSFTQSILPIPQSVDGEMYEKAKDAYMMYAQIEVDSANVMKAEFEDLREQAYLVSAHTHIHTYTCTFLNSPPHTQVHREYVLQCFLKKNRVLKDVIEFQFEPYGQDQVRTFTR